MAQRRQKKAPMDITALLLSRLQFAFTVSFLPIAEHWVEMWGASAWSSATLLSCECGRGAVLHEGSSCSGLDSVFALGASCNIDRRLGV
jgi:hypothetical protein